MGENGGYDCQTYTFDIIYFLFSYKNCFCVNGNLSHSRVAKLFYAPCLKCHSGNI